MPDCASDDLSVPPRIASPLRNVTYAMRRGTADTISLETSVAAEVRYVFWFDGSALIGRQAITEGATAWRPEVPGIHVVRVVDDHGRSAERDVEVTFTN